MNKKELINLSLLKINKFKSLNNFFINELYSIYLSKFGYNIKTYVFIKVIKLNKSIIKNIKNIYHICCILNGFLLDIRINNYNIFILKDLMISKIINVLKYNFFTKFDYLVDIIAIDGLGLTRITKNNSFNNLFALSYNLNLIQEYYRYEINYIFKSSLFSEIFQIKVFLSEKFILHSLSKVYKASLWAEREVWDMYGLYFFKHKDLRRILTDYGFQGKPFLKDFPLTGFYEIRYDDTKKRIVSEGITLSQDFRVFEHEGTWLKTKMFK